MQITLSSIADHLDLSKSTVSKALRNHPTIPEATCQRVKAAAEELGYKPNPMVSALMTNLRRGSQSQAHNTIAFVSGIDADDVRQARYPARYFKACEAQVKALGYKLEVHSNLQAEARLSDILRCRGIQGLILAFFGRQAQLTLDWEQFSVVGISNLYDGFAFDYVENDHYTLMLDALENLRRLGYSRIGVCLMRMFDWVTEGRYLAAALKFRHQQQIDCLELLEIGEPDSFHASNTEYDRLSEWIRDQALEVVLMGGAEPIEELALRGIKVPENVAYASLDVMPEQAGKVAGMVQNYEEVAATAVELLEAKLHLNQCGIGASQHITSVRGSWVDGTSAPPRHQCG